MALQSFRTPFTAYVQELQDRICAGLEAIDTEGRFKEDHWERPGGGGGRTRVMAGGKVFEKGGVNSSAVEGELPEPIKKQFEVEQGWFYATGLSLVLHPWSPLVPTVHANYRYFELYQQPDGPPTDAWFGGGADLTPYYLQPEDALHFHQAHFDACKPFGPELYDAFKQRCDEYFWNHHRGEARGIGGLFYDYLRDGQHNRPLETWHRFNRALGDHFLEAYAPIAERRKHLPYTPEQRHWQEIRRGRYVEFNLIHDKGTLFGLRSNGRTESILMSLPPRVRWEYQHQPPGPAEEALLQVLTQPRDWLQRG